MLQPQKMKKKQSMETRARDSNAVTKLQSTLSTTENSTSGHRENTAQLGARLEKSKSGHRKTDGDDGLAQTQKSNPSRRNIDGGDQPLPIDGKIKNKNLFLLFLAGYDRSSDRPLINCVD